MIKIFLHLLIAISLLIFVNCETTSSNSNSAIGVAPTISLIGADTVNLNMGETYTDSGCIALDSEDGVLTDSVIITYYKEDKNTVINFNDLTDSIGTYWVKYTVTDKDNNTSVKWRCVIIGNAGNRPTIDLLGDDTVSAKSYSSFLEPGYLCTDIEDGDLYDSVQVKWYESDKSTEFDTVAIYEDSIAFIKYYVTDSHGNYAEAWRCIKFNSSSVSDQMNGVWEVTGVFDNSATNVNILDTLLLGYESLKVPMYVNLNTSYDGFESTMGPLFLYLIFGKSNWTTFNGRLDQIFNYVSGRYFTDGEWVIADSGNSLIIKAKLVPPSMNTFKEILDLVPGINTHTLYKYLIPQYSGIEVEIISDSIIEWNFTDDVRSIFYTQNDMLEPEMWNGWNSAAFSRCRIVFKKCAETLEQKMDELR